MLSAVFHTSLLRIIVSQFRRFGLLSLLLIGMRVSGADLSVKVAPPESWVHSQFYDQQSAANPADSTADDYLLLQEHQINAFEDEAFIHSDRQILNLDGVQNDSTLTINFNPNYQSVTLHWVRIWRDGQHFDRLDTNKIEIVQQEKDMDEFTLNGEKSIILVLDDVRVGDIIDYACTIEGNNPVFDGHFSDEVPVQEIQPAGRFLTRLIWPRQKPLFAKPHACSVQPVIALTKDSVEYTWDFRGVPGATMEDLLPAWYDPEKWVQLSDFKTWRDVNQWALKLFDVALPLSPELSQKVAELKRIPGHEEQILAALRFVQDEVRYFGIEIGPGTVKPTDPSLVYSRRFGDCKDKSLLFVSILRELGIEAYPVLVNATLCRAIGDWQPSSGAFDHCIAEFQCDGQTFWVDPTLTYQRGPLATHYLPPYGYGLVIAPWTIGLTAIPQVTGLSKTTTTEYFQIGRAGEPSSLKVVTLAEGRDAEGMRELFATSRLSDIGKFFTQFYSSFYAGVTMSSPIVTEDNQEQNTFQTTEFYSLDKMWAKQASGAYECEFFPVTMRPYLKAPADTDRTLPLAISFPEHQILRMEVTLPDALPAFAAEKTISNPTFTFHKSRQSGGNRMVIQYEYQSLADSVSTDDISEYLAQLDECSKLLGNSVTWKEVMVWNY
jgi:transglutaminase-like putative cysteine protease